MIRSLNIIFSPFRLVYAGASLCLYNREAHRSKMAQLAEGERLFIEALVGGFITALAIIAIVFASRYIAAGSILV